MLLTAVNGRIATILRLVGLGLISLSIFGSKAAPATSGRGLLVLIAFVLAAAAWLVWTAWSSRQSAMTADLYVLAIAGGLIQSAAQSSAASAFVFVVAMVAAARAGLLHGLVVAALGAAAVGVGAIVYDNSGLGALAYALGFAAVTLGGSNIRQTRMRLEQSELLLAQSQRSHEEQLRSARLEESARIARDIHDVLAHSLAGLVIQLEATDALLAQGAADSDAIRERVQRAHELARDGLVETRRAVGALRGDAAVAPEAAIRALVDQHEPRPDFSLSTEDASRLDGAVGEAVVRVVQESLTNARKHTPGAEVTVNVTVASHVVDVVVENQVPAPVLASSVASSGGGYGLRGMRERAAQLGGTLSAGPTESGWRVVLHLPRDQPPEPRS